MSAVHWKNPYLGCSVAVLQLSSNISTSPSFGFSVFPAFHGLQHRLLGQFGMVLPCSLHWVIRPTAPSRCIDRMRVLLQAAPWVRRAVSPHCDVLRLVCALASGSGGDPIAVTCVSKARYFVSWRGLLRSKAPWTQSLTQRHHTNTTATNTRNHAHTHG